MRFLVGTLCLLPLWHTGASLIFTWLTERFHSLKFAVAWSWGWLFWCGLWEGFWPGDPLALLESAAAAGALIALVIAVATIGRRPRQSNTKSPTRAETATHGRAREATKAEAGARFPGVSDDGYGGIPVARNYRRDRSRWAEIPFVPRDKSTWSDAPKAEMLVDPCTTRSTMSAWFAGSGVGKSQTLIQALAHPRFRWLGSYVLGDPKGELAAQTRRTREAMGHKVFEVGIGKDGLNVCDAIDPKSPDFVIDTDTLVSDVFPEAPPTQASDTDEWVMWAKLACSALLLEMLSNPEWPREDRNLRTFKQAVSAGQDELWQVLEGIARFSQFTPARQNANSVLIKAAQTWAGVYASIQAGTKWLSSPMLADMVSDASFHPADICRRPITVYLQPSPKALKEAPGVARVLYGSLLRSAYDANGFIRGRILFDIDEAYTLGRMGIFELVRDLGRSYGITCRWWFQSLSGQLELLYRDGSEAWFDSLAYTAFAGVGSLKTARLIAEYSGVYGAVLENKSNNHGRSTQAGAIFATSYSSGDGKSENEVQRALIKEQEVLSMADDEVIFLTRGMSRGVSMIRATLPLAFMDPEIAPFLDENPLDAARKAWLKEGEVGRSIAA